MLELTQFGNPLLRKPAKPVSERFRQSPEFAELVEEMFRTMYREEGIGLAAPQIGEPLQLAVIELQPTVSRPELKNGERIVMLNPKIVRRSKEAALDWEGCLSLDGVRGRVPRSQEITVRYLNAEGKPVARAAKGLLARVFQHEIDHLGGRLYVDRMKDMKTLMTYQEYLKRVVRVS